jgi:hypothetical protein
MSRRVSQPGTLSIRVLLFKGEVNMKMSTKVFIAVCLGISGICAVVTVIVKLV